MRLSPLEFLVLCFFMTLVWAAYWCITDALRLPAKAWQQAGLSRNVIIIMLILGVPTLLDVVFVPLYRLSWRPKALMAQERAARVGG